MNCNTTHYRANSSSVPGDPTRSEPALAERLGLPRSGEQNALSAALPELAFDLDGAAAGSLGPEAYGEARCLDALAALLDALGSIDRPAVVVLDDCQWADDLTVKLLSHWQRRREQKGADGLLLVAAFRSEEVPEDHPLRALRPATQIILPPFGPRDLRHLVESMAGSLPEEVLVLVEQLSDGSPFMASAVLHGLVEAGALAFGPSGWHVEAARIEEVSASRQAATFLARRLDILPPDVLGLLSIGALLGKEFDLPLAAALASQTTSEALAAAREASRRQIIWIKASGMRCVYVHDRLREALLLRIPKDERMRLHRAAAEALDAEDPERVFEIAYHFEAAGEPGRALPYALKAADRARARSALELAERHYRIAEQSAGDADAATRLRVAEGLGDVLLLRGRYAEAQVELDRARSLCEETLARAEIDRRLGELAFKRGDMKGAVLAVERGLRQLGRGVPRRKAAFVLLILWEVFVQTLHSIFPRLFLARRALAGAGPDLLAMRLYSRLTYAYWFSGGKVPCVWAHLRELNLAERYPPTAELAQAYSAHAPMMTVVPWLSRGIAYVTRSLAIRRELGDTWGQGQSLGFYGVVLYAASRYEECIETCLEASRLLDRAGDHWEANTARWHVAFAKFRLGDLAGSLALCEAVHRAGRELGDHQASGICLGGWAKAAEGQISEALIEAELLHPSDDVPTQLEVLQADALRLLALDRPSDAVLRLEEAQRRVDEVGLRQEYAAAVLPWLVTALRREVEATPAYAEARRAARLRKAARVARRALGVARSYRNNLPHALREAALIAAIQGRSRRAAALLAESLEIAEAQGARYESAQTRLARGALGVELGLPGAAAELAGAEEALRAIRAPLPRPEEPAPHTISAPPATLSLADRFENVLAAGRAIASALSRPEIFAAVRSAVLLLVRGERCVILGVEDDGGPAPKLATVSGEPDGGEYSRTLVRRALEARRAVLFNEGAEPSPDDSLLLGGVRSALCAPIIVRGRAAQCFYISSRGASGIFDEDAMRLADFIAAVAGAALENAAGFGEVQTLSASLEKQVAELALTNQELSRSLEQLNKAQRELAQAGRMATVGTLAAGVAHEINNPLAYVIGNLELATADLEELVKAGTVSPGEPAGRAIMAVLEGLRDARDGADRVRRIVLDLKLFSRPDDALQAVDLRKVLDATINIVWNELRHRVRLVKEYGAIPRVRGSESRLGQVFLNLLVNALHATPEGRLDQHELAVVTRTDAAGRAVVEVRDTGSGIAPEVIPRIFDPFFTTKAVGVGTGLGLSICHGIVTALGGEIAVESVVGKGSTFRVTLPPDEPAPAPAPRAAEPEAKPAPPRRRLLVVDDEPSIGRVLKRSLGEHHVEVVAGAREALALLDSGALFDVIFCDLMMPEMTGMDFHEELGKDRPELASRVVFMTGGTFTPGAQSFLDQVPNRRIDKPFDLTRVRAMVLEASST